MPSAPIQPRYMPSVLNGNAALPCASSAMAPPSPPAVGISMNGAAFACRAALHQDASGLERQASRQRIYMDVEFL
ncbi:hypothetical protein DXO150_12940 [Xanthomonas oryzae pv. oryzae]|nr:hypothetical protein BXO589_05080 [Xanthomonas oryzae pv. oryzae]OLH18549.1 hypothetical protein BXO590_19105 [Xanthomonas oryzae pv. oryzae]OLH33211.1 hypothetical protein DXO116_13000 [Xanthomonas oryzae pv. oryzae]OLH56589.1 hypothetical protein DXO150_12940 [Xanthomonas oryzae pv. oryzae]OLI89766.1 hypothetical protein IXO278_02175 [Xanthomonas oryzae pv. oryzae]